jgi:hypothetical protein
MRQSPQVNRTTRNTESFRSTGLTAVARGDRQLEGSNKGKLVVTV